MSELTLVEQAREVQNDIAYRVASKLILAMADRIEGLEAEIADLSQVAAQYKAEVEALTHNANTMNEILDKVTAERDALKEERDEYERQWREIGKFNADFSRVNKTLKAENAALREALEESKSDYEQALADAGSALMMEHDPAKRMEYKTKIDMIEVRISRLRQALSTQEAGG